MFGKLSKLYRRTKEAKGMEELKKTIHSLFAGKKCFVRYSIVNSEDGNIDHFYFTQGFPIVELSACQKAQHDFVARQMERSNVKEVKK